MENTGLHWFDRFVRASDPPPPPPHPIPKVFGNKANSVKKRRSLSLSLSLSLNTERHYYYAYRYCLKKEKEKKRKKEGHLEKIFLLKSGLPREKAFKNWLTPKKNC